MTVVASASPVCEGGVSEPVAARVLRGCSFCSSRLASANMWSERVIPALWDGDNACRQRVNHMLSGPIAPRVSVPLDKVEHHVGEAAFVS
jgi:hypothetical protein